MDKLKLAALGERLKIGGERLRTGGAEMGRRVSGKMKEILQAQSQESKMVDEATLDSLEEPNWGLNMKICALLNSEEFNGPEVMRAIKKKIAGKNAVSQRLSLDLLEACAMNCEKVFSEVASEKVLDEMVKMIDNPQTHHSNKQRALQLIKAWGQSEDLAYLPVFHQTYMNLKNRKTEPPKLGDRDSTSALSPGISELLSHPEGYPVPNMNQQVTEQIIDYHGASISVEERREILVETRNSMEVLSSLLNPEAPQNVVKDDLTLTLLKRCKDSQPVIQRILESVGDDEALLFEALNLHEELQQVLSKYADIEAAVRMSDADGVEGSALSATENVGERHDDEGKSKIAASEKEDGPTPGGDDGLEKKD